MVSSADRGSGAATPDDLRRYEALLAGLRGMGSAVIAFSGGVDSTFLLHAAREALGESVLAVTATSPTYPASEREEARRIAGDWGVRHRLVESNELEIPGFSANPPDRCYHCKTDLFEQLVRMLPELGVDAVVSGANADDAGDYRPGQRAAAEHRICSPLAECGVTKDEVRALAAEWGLPIWDKHALPCLSSRVAYGEEVTPERLQMIDRAEQYLPGGACPAFTRRRRPGPDRCSGTGDADLHTTDPFR